MFVFRFSEEIPNEENEIISDNLTKSSAEAKPEGSPPLLHKKVMASSTIPLPGNNDTPLTVSVTLSSVKSHVRGGRKRSLTRGLFPV